MNYVIIYSIPGVMALVAAFALLLKKHRNSAQVILAISMMVYAASQLYFAQYFNPALSHNAIFDPACKVLALLAPPFYCFFIAVLTYPKMRYIKGLIFFAGSIPYIILYFIAFSRLSPADFEVYSFNVLGHVPFSSEPSRAVRFMFFAGARGFLVFMMTLLGLTIYSSLVRLNKYCKILMSYDSRVTELIRWPRKLVIYFTCCFLPAWALEFILFNAGAPKWTLTVVCIFISCMFLMICVHGYRISFTSRDLKRIFKEADNEQPETQPVPDVVTPQQSEQELEQLELVSKKLAQAIDEDKMFLDPELTIITLADKIGTNRNYLNKVINTLYGKSFFDYIRALRIGYAQKLLIERKGHPGDNNAFCKECGYCFYSVFLDEFKAVTGKSLSNWTAENIK